MFQVWKSVKVIPALPLHCREIVEEGGGLARIAGLGGDLLLLAEHGKVW